MSSSKISKPPFLGRRVSRGIPLDDIYPLIDERLLFVGQWRLVSNDRRPGEEAKATMEDIKKKCRDEGILEPGIVYGYFKSDKFDFEMDEKMAKGARRDFFILQLVTVGSGVNRECDKLYSKGKYRDYFYLHGFGVAVTEALAEFSHQNICTELGLEQKETRRISPGYPVWPRLTEQEKIFKLLKPQEIGVELTESSLMVPEYSTSAMVLWNL